MTSRATRRTGAAAALLVLVLLLGLPAAAAACATCFGAPDSAMTAGLNRAILALLGCVGLVWGGLFRLIWTVRRHARRRRRLESGA